MFGTALPDQLVCDIRSSNTQRKLLSEDRSFDQAMEMALAVEVADDETKQIVTRHSLDSTETIAGVFSNQKNRENRQSPTKVAKHLENSATSAMGTTHTRSADVKRQHVTFVRIK